MVAAVQRRNSLPYSSGDGAREIAQVREDLFASARQAMDGLDTARAGWVRAYREKVQAQRVVGDLEQERHRLEMTLIAEAQKMGRVTWKNKEEREFALEFYLLQESAQDTDYAHLCLALGDAERALEAAKLNEALTAKDLDSAERRARLLESMLNALAGR